MGYGESDTRAKLIDPAIHTCGWTEDLIHNRISSNFGFAETDLWT